MDIENHSHFDVDRIAQESQWRIKRGKLKDESGSIESTRNHA
jgi:hypothetical protein